MPQPITFVSPPHVLLPTVSACTVADDEGILQEELLRWKAVWEAIVSTVPTVSASEPDCRLVMVGNSSPNAIQDAIATLRSDESASEEITIMAVLAEWSCHVAEQLPSHINIVVFADEPAQLLLPLKLLLNPDRPIGYDNSDVVEAFAGNAGLVARVEDWEAELSRPVTASSRGRIALVHSNEPDTLERCEAALPRPLPDDATLLVAVDDHEVRETYADIATLMSKTPA